MRVENVGQEPKVFSIALAVGIGYSSPRTTITPML